MEDEVSPLFALPPDLWETHIFTKLDLISLTRLIYAVPSKRDSIERAMRAKLKNLLLADKHNDLYYLMWMCVAKNEPDLLRFMVASSNFSKFQKFPYFCLPWSISNKQFEVAKILMASGLKFPDYRRNHRKM